MALQQGIKVGDMELAHRVALAPLTRMRAAEPGLGPAEAGADYYSQRGSPGGLLISEGVAISPAGVGYANVPGIWTEDQVKAWKVVTSAVHKKGAKIMCQLWHTGRIGHESFKEHPLLTSRPAFPVSSTTTPSRTKTRTYKGFLPCSVPQALTVDGIKAVIQEYRTAARNAMQAGFDGVEIHSAHGYLLDQFLNSDPNTRTDGYGGSIAKRARLLLEVTKAVCDEVGSSKVAVRLSPTTKGSAKHGTSDENPVALYSYVVSSLNYFNLAYLLLSEPRFNLQKNVGPENDPGFNQPLINGEHYRKIYEGVLVGSGGFTPASAEAAVAEGIYDMIAFGRWFISNPDLPERLRTGVPLTRYERKTFYGGSTKGYTDYPTFDAMAGSSYTLMAQDKIGSSLATAKL